MNYIKGFEEELAHKIDSGVGRDEIVHWVSNKVLQSFKNGVIAGKTGKLKRDSLQPPSELPIVPQA